MSKLLPDWRNLSLKEQIGQMIVVRASGFLFDHQIRYPTWEAQAARLKGWLEDLNLGGVILLGGSAGEMALRCQQLQEWAKIPLFLAADIEEGVGQRFAGATWFPPPMALGAIYNSNQINPPQPPLKRGELALRYAEKMGAITAQEALGIGLNWILAPVVDVNNNPDNPVINVRSFGEQPQLVGELAASFIQGARNYPVLTTAKHFPGHGDTATDSHLNLPVIPHDNDRLETLELVPFRSAIASGVDTVMTAHLLIPAWDQQLPATLSPQILTGKLRENLGFEGLIVTDALIMGGIANYASPEEVAVLAVNAGADILLMPDHPVTAINAVYEAVMQGKITRDRIESSLERIWQAKQKLGYQLINSKSDKLGDYNPKSSNLSTNLTQLAQPEARHTVDLILSASLQSGGKLPLTIEKSTYTTNKDNSEHKAPLLRNLIIVDDILNCDYLDRFAPAITIPQKLGYHRQIIEQSSYISPSPHTSHNLLQIFIRGNPFRGSAGISPEIANLYQTLLQKTSIKGLIIYGSPYIKEWFCQQLNNDIPWVFTYGQMPQAQAIACQLLFGLSEFNDLTDRTFE